MDLSPILRKKILITGASGFIGSHLCRRLGKFDVELHALSRIEQNSLQKNIRWWIGNIRDKEVIAQLLQSIKPDFIIHLASYVKGSRGASVVLPTFQNNLMGQVYLLVETLKIGCQRFIAAGSMEEPRSCDKWFMASSPYAVAKIAASLYGKMFYDIYDFPFVSLRVFMVYGPGQMDISKLIPYSILSMLRGESPNLSSGKRMIDWVYVEDVVDGVLAAMFAPNIEGEILDIGSGKSLSIFSVEEKLIKLINPKIEPNYGALSDRFLEQEPVANVAETYARIGWKPKIFLDVGLEKTVKWYKENMHCFGKA